MERVACGPLHCYGCYGQEGMTVDLNRLILGKSYNSTKVFRTAQHVVQAILLGVVVPALILLLIWDLTDNPNPVPGVVVIAGLVMLCFFFLVCLCGPRRPHIERNRPYARHRIKNIRLHIAWPYARSCPGRLQNHSVRNYRLGHLLYRRQAGAGKLGRGLGKVPCRHPGGARDHAQP